MNETPGRFRKYLRWYPRDWRAQHEDAVIGDLADLSRANGGRIPFSERHSLLIRGFIQRFLVPQPATRGKVLGLSAAAAFAVWYQAVIAWAPSVTYDGTFGPFANPLIIASVLIVLALPLSVAGFARTGRLLLWCSCVASVSIGAASNAQNWLGPSPSTVVLFVLVGGLGAIPWTRVRSAVVALGAGLLLSVLVMIGDNVANSLAGNFSAEEVWPGLLALAIALIGLFAIAVCAWRLETPAPSDDDNGLASRP